MMDDRRRRGRRRRAGWLVELQATDFIGDPFVSFPSGAERLI
jgi:hypothetical protein